MQSVRMLVQACLDWTSTSLARVSVVPVSNFQWSQCHIYTWLHSHTHVDGVVSHQAEHSTAASCTVLSTPRHHHHHPPALHAVVVTWQLLSEVKYWGPMQAIAMRIWACVVVHRSAASTAGVLLWAELEQQLLLWQQAG